VELTEDDLVCATCLLACGRVGVKCVMTVNNNGEGQVRSPCAMDQEQ
jgi:hypothetical protein